LIGREKQRELAKIEAEIDNIHIAWNWAVSQARIENINLSLQSLAEFYGSRARFQEGEEAYAKAAQVLINVQPTMTNRRVKIVYARVLSWQGRFLKEIDQVEKGKELLRNSLAIFRDLDMQREIARSLCELAHVTSSYEERESLVEEAVIIFQELGDQNGLVNAFHLQGWSALHQGEFEKARQLFQEGLAISREVGHQGQIANSLDLLGKTAWVVGEYRQAEQLHQESLALWREIDNQGGIAQSLTLLGEDAMGMKALGKARHLIEESLAICQEFNLTWYMARSFNSLARVVYEMGEYTNAIQFAQECIEHSRTLSNTFWEALAFGVLGDATKDLGNLRRSRNYYRQALETAMTFGEKPAILLTLVGIANLLAIEGDKRKSLELLTLTRHHPASLQWTKDEATAQIAELEAELSPDVVFAAQERGQGLEMEPTIAELLTELAY
jgi:tetratricopeptide (TPR) repeat protein